MSTSQGVTFLKKKNVNGESKWFEDGDEENDGKYVGKIENQMVTGHSLHLMEIGIKENGRMVNNMVKEPTFGLMVKSMKGNGKMG